MAVTYKITGLAGLNVQRFADLDDAIAFARSQFSTETLEIDDSTPRRDESERRAWLVYDESDDGEFADNEIYIVEVESV